MPTVRFTYEAYPNSVAVRVYVPGRAEELNVPFPATTMGVAFRWTEAPEGETNPASVPGTAARVRLMYVSFPGVTFPTRDAGQWPRAHAWTRKDPGASGSAT
jgi:hypothetical protein